MPAPARKSRRVTAGRTCSPRSASGDEPRGGSASAIARPPLFAAQIPACRRAHGDPATLPVLPEISQLIALFLASGGGRDVSGQVDQRGRAIVAQQRVDRPTRL